MNVLVFLFYFYLFFYSLEYPLFKFQKYNSNKTKKKMETPMFKLPMELVRSVTDYLSLQDKLSFGQTCNSIHQEVNMQVWGRVHLDLCKVVTKPHQGLSCYRGQWQKESSIKPRIAISTSNLKDVVEELERGRGLENWKLVHTFSIHVELESIEKSNSDMHLLLERLFELLPRLMTNVIRVKFFCGGELANSKNGTTFCGGMDALMLMNMLSYYRHASWSVKVQGIACHAFRQATESNVRHLEIRTLNDESPWQTLQYMFQSEIPALPPTIEHFAIDGAFGAAWSMTYDDMGHFFANATRLTSLHTSPPIANLMSFVKLPASCYQLSFSYYKNKSSCSEFVSLPQVCDLKISCDTLEFLPNLDCRNLRNLKIAGAPSLELLVPFLAKNPHLESLSLSAATAQTKIPADLLRYNKIKHFEANQHLFDTLQPFFKSKSSVKSLVICVSTNKDAVAVRCIKYALKVFPHVDSIRVTGHTTDKWIEHTNWAKLLGIERKPSGNLNVDLDKCAKFNTSRPASPMPTASLTRAQQCTYFNL